MCLLGWWKCGIRSGSQVQSAVSYPWGSGVPCADQIARPGLAMRHCQNKETCHVLGEVWNKAVLKQEAEVFFSLVFAKCIYTWSSWPPLVQTSLGNIFHLSCSHAKKTPGDSIPIPETEPLFVSYSFQQDFY